MNEQVDFVLPTCHGMPDAIWATESKILNNILAMCINLLAPFLVIKILSDGISEVGMEPFSLSKHIRTVLQGVLLLLFFVYFKPLLMFFDDMLSGLCSFGDGILQDVQLPQEPQGSSIWLWKMWHNIWKFVGDMAHLFTVNGSICLMHMIKCVLLIIIVPFGPISALFSLLPGPFRRSFSTWTKSYVNISFWHFTLSLLDTISSVFNKISFPGVADATLSIAIVFAVFFTPSLTSKLIGSAIVSNLGTGILQGVTAISSIASRLMKK